MTCETVPNEVVEVWLPVRSVRFVAVDGVLGKVGPIKSEDEMVFVIVSGRIREPVSELEPVMETFEEPTTVKTLVLVTVLGPEMKSVPLLSTVLASGSDVVGIVSVLPLKVPAQTPCDR
jgi:hypothetical protein